MKKFVSLLLVVLLACGVMASASAELLGPGNVTLKRLSVNVGFDVNEDQNGKNYQKTTGYDVEYYSMPAKDADQKVLLDLGSGSATYDIEVHDEYEAHAGFQQPVDAFE